MFSPLNKQHPGYPRVCGAWRGCHLREHDRIQIAVTWEVCQAFGYCWPGSRAACGLAEAGLGMVGCLPLPSPPPTHPPTSHSLHLPLFLLSTKAPPPLHPPPWIPILHTPPFPLCPFRTPRPSIRSSLRPPLPPVLLVAPWKSREVLFSNCWARVGL